MRCHHAFLLSVMSVFADASMAQSPSSMDDGVAKFNAVRGDRPYGWLGQTRSETLGMNGMVATSQPLAAEAGLDILKAGGNAFDAAVATAASLNVVEPLSAGIGGDMFMIAWVAKERRLVALDGSGRASSGATRARFTGRGLKQIPYYGIDTAVTPGAVDGWDVLLKRYGSMGFDRVLEPAARIAEQGFGVSERISHEWQEAAEILSKDADSAHTYLPGGRAPATYQVFRNPDLAKALRLIQREGRDAFYRGAIGKALVAKSQALGGSFTMADLAGIHARWVTPLTTRHNGYDIYEMPPPTQGVAVLEALNIVERCAPKLGIVMGPDTPRSPAFWHMMLEAKKLAYADLDRWVGDPDFTKVPTDQLVSKSYADQLCAKIDPSKASKIAPGSEPVGGTVYLATADRYGNVVSLIYSVYVPFGSGITVPGFGFVLNDRAASFSLDPASPNVIAPGKRPFYTIIPGFVMKDGKPLMAVGVMSGDQQAQGQQQVLVNMLDLGVNPQAASDAARFNHSQRVDHVLLENELFTLVGPQLQAMGHDVQRSNGEKMGGYQAIRIDPATGLMRGASDHRKDGAAVGY